MRVLEVSTTAAAGGAAAAAKYLHTELIKRGHRSQMIVGRQKGDFTDVLELQSRAKLPRVTRAVSALYSRLEFLSGIQGWAHREFDYWWSRNPERWNVTILHNLHDNYFNLGVIPNISLRCPVVCVLHDLWLTTGHCAYPMKCERWKAGCGNCPDLHRYPGIWRDATSVALRRKRKLLEESGALLVCVSDWVQRQVADSALSGLARTVIPYGIPDVPSRPELREVIRGRLGWPINKTIYLYVSSGGLRGNPYKDPATVVQAALALVESGTAADKLIVTVGGRASIDPRLSQLVLQYDHVTDTLPDMFAAADVFIYPTTIETCGLVLVEAARAGLPSIAVNVGGCPEVLRHGETGLLIPPHNPSALTKAMCDLQLMDLPRLRLQSREHFLNHFTVERMADQYIRLFETLCATPRAAGQYT